MSHGYQVCQTSHAVAQFSHEHPETFKDWFKDSQYLISLQVSSEDELLKTFGEIKKLFPETVIDLFFEPDVDEHTSLCLYANEEVMEYLQKFQLIGSSQKEEVLA